MIKKKKCIKIEILTNVVINSLFKHEKTGEINNFLQRYKIHFMYSNMW